MGAVAWALGRSGGGIARPGFEKLLAAICEGRIGAVLSIEASRLARNVVVLSHVSGAFRRGFQGQTT
jgi:DNA invertase Pin-like site-specific DNA recombinase